MGDHDHCHGTNTLGTKACTCPCHHKQLFEAAENFIKKLANNMCPTCGEPIEPATVVGRCKYAACGHRVGQVG